MPVWLGLDLGTSGLRALLLDGARGVLATAGWPYAISAPAPGWAEQDPRDWWDAAGRAVREVLSEAGIRPGDVTAIGVTGQMHGLVLVDERGRPTRPAIIWPDRRSAVQVRRLQGDPAVQGRAGMAATTGLLGPSLAWVREHEPETYAAARWAMLPKDFLRYLLTGEVHSEPSDACGTLLLDIHDRVWSPHLVDALGLEPGLLPPLVASTSVAGSVTPEAAEALGLAAGTPVVAGASDQATSALALGLTEPGDTSVAISSGGTVVQLATAPPRGPRPDVSTLCSASDGYLLMAATLTAGLALRWLADLLAGPTVPELAHAASRVPPGAGGLLFLPYLAGERTDPEAARGCFLGLTLDHGAGELARAVMEGVAFALADCVDAVGAVGARPGSVVAGGGGLHNPAWRQIVVDVLGLPLRVTDVVEHSALGAALLAARGVGTVEGTPGPPRSRTVEVVEVTSPSPYAALRPAFQQAHRDVAQTIRALRAALPPDKPYEE